MSLGRLYLRSLAAAVATLLLLNLAAAAFGYRWLNRRSDDLGEVSILPVYAARAQRPDAVFLGSSHSWSGVLPWRVAVALEERLGRPAEVWNLGLPGGLATQLPGILEVVFEAPVPRVLLVEADPIFWNHWPDWEQFNQEILSFLGREEAVAGEGIEARLSWWAEQYAFGPTALWRQAHRLLSKQARERAQLPRLHGGRWTPAELARDRATPGPLRPDVLLPELEDPEKRRPATGAVRATAVEAEVLVGLLARCRAQGVQVVFYRLPITDAFRGMLGADDAVQRAWLAEQAPGVPLLDLDTPANRSLEGFRDLDHLDPSGAESVALQLAAALEAFLEPDD